MKKIIKWVPSCFFALMMITGGTSVVPFGMAAIMLMPIPKIRELKQQFKIGPKLTVLLAVVLLIVGSLLATTRESTSPDPGSSEQNQTGVSEDVKKEEDLKEDDGEAQNEKTEDGKKEDEKLEEVEKTLVAEALSSDVYVPDGIVITDLVTFSDGALGFDELAVKEENAQRRYNGNKAGYELIKNYVDTLISEYDFEYAGTPHYQTGSRGDIFFDFVLRYIGAEELSGKEIEGAFSKITGDIMIYGTIERDRLKGCIYYNPKITAYDDGLRYGAESADNSLVGSSVATGLYEMPDGSYETTDGRLHTAKGEAMVLSDGNVGTYSARFVRNQDAGHQEVYVEDEHGTVRLEFYVPNGERLTSGKLFTERDFMIEAGYAVRDGGRSDDVPGYAWNYMFTTLHDVEYHFPITAMEGCMKRLNVRVMHVQEDNVAVLHVGVRYDSAPYEEEYLIAVPIDAGTVVVNQPDDEFTVYIGEKISIDGPKEFDSTYDLWKWEFIENGQIAEMSGDVNRAVSIIGKEEGDVRIRVTYDYGVEEPDVLTGNKGYASKSESREYVIHVVKR